MAEREEQLKKRQFDVGTQIEFPSSMAEGNEQPKNRPSDVGTQTEFPK